MKLLGVVAPPPRTEEKLADSNVKGSYRDTAIAIGEYTLIETVEDLDVSGCCKPVDRGSSRPCGRPSRPRSANEAVRLDYSQARPSACSLHDFASLVKWCNANGKTIISISESLDLSTSHGRMLANILITFAEFERERISERRREAAVKLRQDARWGGGRVPFGYCAVKTAVGWELEPDPKP